ncbi:T9SS-dependent choice-of-anchor J family protein [Lacinutrix jangbogonensis]|uniref:T9SS-dependent choice-of-anchor J family protein n=1 Tax=Lacinutrix jangbogonensis TaxID=1469557 RepID=UPI00053EB219|nr:T9SS type A sorting domain-containing protein [Lacinutrix jangbogonensis]
MKKITLLLLCFSLNFTFSQVIFEDDFDGSGPGFAAWSVYDVDGNTVNANVAQFTSAWIEEQATLVTAPPDDLVAKSTSWYSPAGTSDDWLVTPAMNLTGFTGDPILTWEENAPDAAYADGYEVRVSTTGNTPADFTDAPIFTIANASGGTGVWASQSVNLNAYVGNAVVYIAWRNTSTDKFVLQINNVKVEVPPAFDAGITTNGETQDQYTQIPLEQIVAMGTNAIINNIGDAVTNAIATVTVADGGGTVYTESSTPIAIAAGAVQAVTFTGYIPTAVGTFTTTYSVAIAEVDGDPANDTTTSNDTEVTTNTYARDNGIVTGSLGIGTGTTSGQLGQQFDIIETEAILSVTFQLENGSDLLTGSTTFVKVWSMAGGIPDAIIAQTDVVTILTGSNLYTANIVGGAFNLNPGVYVITVEEGVESISLAHTDEIHTPGTTWINWPTNPNGTWSNNEDFNVDVSYILRPNFQDNTLGVDNFDVENITIGLYPNPATDFVTISNPNGVSLQEAIIVDIAGRVVKTYNLGSTIDSEKTIDVSSLNAAAYFVTIKSSHGAITKKLIIN